MQSGCVIYLVRGCGSTFPEKVSMNFNLTNIFLANGLVQPPTKKEQ